MQRVAFKMKLFKGCEAEYQQRHAQLWPELKELLKQAEVKDYSIFLDEETSTLFGYLTTENLTQLDNLKNDPIMQKWWIFMKDIMETNDEHLPVTINLKEVFYLP